MDGVAGKEAKSRFCELEEYFRFRFFPVISRSSRFCSPSEQEVQGVENMRRLLRILRKLPGDMTHTRRNDLVSHDDLLCGILHYVFYALERLE